MGPSCLHTNSVRVHRLYVSGGMMHKYIYTTYVVYTKHVGILNAADFMCPLEFSSSAYVSGRTFDGNPMNGPNGSDDFDVYVMRCAPLILFAVKRPQTHNCICTRTLLQCGAGGTISHPTVSPTKNGVKSVCHAICALAYKSTTLLCYMAAYIAPHKIPKCGAI